jgi:ATP-dependent Clp protease ATP-binding subunit ClpC
MIARLDGQLKNKDMGLELTPAAKALLAKKGYDPVLGARPLRRTIQREIEDPLSEKILFSELRPGSIVVVDVEGTGEEAKFNFTSSPKATLPEITTPADIPAEVIADSIPAPDSPAA